MKKTKILFGLVLYVETPARLLRMLEAELGWCMNGNNNLCAAWGNVEEARDNTDYPALRSFLEHVLQKGEQGACSGIGDVVFWCNQEG